MPRFDSNTAQQRWESCRSIVNEEIPAFACVQVVDSGLAEDAGSISDEPLLRVQKPNTGEIQRLNESSELVEAYASCGHRFRFNGPTPIAPLGFGYVTRDVPTHALCHSVDTTFPTLEDNKLFAPVAGQWYLGEILRFSGDTVVTDWLAVWQMAFIAPAATSESDCVVGWMIRQSRSQEDLT